MIRKAIGTLHWIPEEGQVQIIAQGSISPAVKRKLQPILQERFGHLPYQGSRRMYARVCPGRSIIEIMDYDGVVSIEFDCLEFINRGTLGPLAQTYVMRWARTSALWHDDRLTNMLIQTRDGKVALDRGVQTCLCFPSERQRPSHLSSSATKAA